MPAKSSESQFSIMFVLTALLQTHQSQRHRRSYKNLRWPVSGSQAILLGLISWVQVGFHACGLDFPDTGMSPKASIVFIILLNSFSSIRRYLLQTHQSQQKARSYNFLQGDKLRAGLSDDPMIYASGIVSIPGGKDVSGAVAQQSTPS